MTPKDVTPNDASPKSPADDSQPDTNQISVAELLARNGQQGAKRDGGRRRGRPGGISVAELTGDLPRLRVTETGSIHAIVDDGDATQAAPAVEQAKVEQPKVAPAVEPAKAAPAVEPAKDGGAPAKSVDVAGQGKVREVPAVAAVPAQQAWSSAREPELISGGTVAGDLLRTQNAQQAVAEKPVPEVDTAAKKATANAKKAAADAKKTAANSKKAAAAEQKAQAKAEAKAAKEAGAAETAHSPARQWLSLAAQAIIAIVAGALLFKGFEQLWVSMPWIALALAVVVIVGLVAVVRILRKTDDMLSLVIAMVVGLFVTLGPLVFVLTTGRG